MLGKASRMVGEVRVILIRGGIRYHSREFMGVLGSVGKVSGWLGVVG